MRANCIFPLVPGVSQPSLQVSSDGAARADDSRRISTREPQSSPPHKARRVDYRGHQTRPKKGHAKRARKEKALAEAAHMCQYYVDDHGGFTV